MKLTKRIISLFMAMLMLCSGMVVTAFAEAATYPYTLNKDNCYVQTDKVRIFVEAASLTQDGEELEIEFTAIEKGNTQAEPLEANYDKDGNTIFPYPATGKTYIVKGSVYNGETSTPVTNEFEVKVLNAKNAPTAPVAKKITATSIEISAVSGCEYRIDGKAYQTSNVFTGLTPDTFYKIEMRYAETSTHYASPAATLSVKTLKTADPANKADVPVLLNKTESTITVKEIDGVEFSINDGATWQASGVFTGLKADTTYTVIARKVYDDKVQEANPTSDPAHFITNARAVYPADIKKCSVTLSDGDNYANEKIKVTVNADTAPNKYEAQYGDTKYVPTYYKVTGYTDTFEFNPSADGKVYTSDFIPGEGNANKEITVTVYFQKMKCRGEDENGKALWINEGEPETKTAKVKVGEVHNFFTDVKNFFLGIFDALFNTIPAAISDMLKGFDLSGLLNGLNDLLKGLEGMDLGALTEGTK